jgi:NDP-sugar pyrophosphorylase family protein
LKRHGISDIAINLHHLGEKVEEYLRDGSAFGVKMIYSRETELLGTALGAKVMSQFFGDVQVVVYGDVLTDFNLTEMLKYHSRCNAVATLALFNKGQRDDVGAVRLRPDDRIISFVEKPAQNDLSCRYANGGIYVVNRSVFDHVPERGFFDFGNDLLPRLISQGLPVYGYKISMLDYLLDIGTAERYAKANEDALKGKVKINLTRPDNKSVVTQGV